METQPHKTDSKTTAGTKQQSSGGKGKAKIEQKFRSDSSESDEEEETKSPKGYVIRTSKLERGRALFLKLMVSPESEAQAKAKQINVQDKVKKLAPSLAKLNWNEWMAIVGHFTFTKESLSKQKRT